MTAKHWHNNHIHHRVVRKIVCISFYSHLKNNQNTNYLFAPDILSTPFGPYLVRNPFKFKYLIIIVKYQSLAPCLPSIRQSYFMIYFFIPIWKWIRLWFTLSTFEIIFTFFRPDIVINEWLLLLIFVALNSYSRSKLYLLLICVC